MLKMASIFLHAELGSLAQVSNNTKRFDDFSTIFGSFSTFFDLFFRCHFHKRRALLSYADARLAFCFERQQAKRCGDPIKKRENSNWIECTRDVNEHDSVTELVSS